MVQSQPAPVVVHDRNPRGIAAFVLLVLAVLFFVIFGLIGRTTLNWKHPDEYLGFGLAFFAAAFAVDRFRW